MRRAQAVRAGIVTGMLFVLLWHAVPAESEPARNGLMRIADGVYAYVDGGIFSAASFGANAGIIVGRDGIVVIDTLISAKETKRFIKDIRAVSDKPIKYVVNTHMHLDHTFGNCSLRSLVQLSFPLRTTSGRCDRTPIKR
jgi:hypothetical protein